MKNIYVTFNKRNKRATLSGCIAVWRWNLNYFAKKKRSDPELDTNFFLTIRVDKFNFDYEIVFAKLFWFIHREFPNQPPTAKFLIHVSYIYS